MRLNRFETWVTNSALRAALQRRVEAPLLLRMGGRLDGARALEIGCGRGVGCEIVARRFGAGRVDAFDLDPAMVARAARRLARRGTRSGLWVGDATAIPAREGTYNAVFDFEILHHVEDWRAALREIHRVLATGGRFFAGEIYGRALRHPFVRRTMVHPSADRFGHRDLVAALEALGFAIVAERRIGDHLGWLVARKGAAEARRGA